MSRLIIATGVPLMLSLLINSLYNFVDSVFVSRVSEDALTALSLSSPVQLLVSALGFGNAIGLNAVISKALGQNDPDKVKKAANGAIFIALCSWILIVLGCLVFVKLYFDWQSGGNEAIAAYGRQYLTVCMLFSFGQMGQWVFDRFVIASGKSHLFLFTLSAASLTNLALDPIFIFGLFGVPRLETLGAAIATVTGQIVGMIAGIVINRRWNKEIPFSFRFRPDRRIIAEILKVGIPSAMIEVLTSVVFIAINTVLLAFSTTAVAVYGVCSKIRSVVTVGVHGIDNGLIPIVAYNYGAGKNARIDEAIRWAQVYSVLFYLPFFILLEFFPVMVLRLFNASENMLALGIPALRIFGVAFFASISTLIFAAALQGLSRGVESMLLTTARQAVLPVAFALLLKGFGVLDLVWASFLLGELVVIPFAARVWRRARRDIGMNIPLDG